jgi:3-methylfumaryl-CoA hydratase
MEDTGAALQTWVGRTQESQDTISEIPVRQMAAAMDDAERMRSPGAGPLPAGWHWLFFNPLELQSRLGEDGHPERGGFLPPVALPRRMWAGSRLRWTRAFSVGATVARSSRILKVAHKSGRSGEMVFVTVGHRYADAQGPLLDEEHDIVYRQAATASERAALAAQGHGAPADAGAFERAGRHRREVRAGPVLLFRYSAATFNGHRIHYDADYCREVEGYPGLVVHGPLIATLLLRFVEQDLAPGRFVRSFEFRAQQPTFDLAPFHLHASETPAGGGYALWSTNHRGQVGLSGQLTLA